MQEEKNKADAEQKHQPTGGQKENNMFYKAHPLIFKKAEELRDKPTPAEELLWNYLRQSQLSVKFRRQHPASMYVLDFYAHQIKLAIEIDGSIHDIEEVKRKDVVRQTHLQSLGINFLRFSNQQVLTEMEFVLKTIKNEINNLQSSAQIAPFRAGGYFVIIPAIDIIDGKCVRLTKGNYSKKKIYNENPLEVAKKFEDAGLKRLHLVDLDGAKAKHIVNWKTLEIISAKTNLHIDFGGGIKSDEDLKTAFECGAKQITAGSIAVTDKPIVLQWLKQYRSEKIILGADVQNEKIAVSGWTEKTNLKISDFLKEYSENGIKFVICTDIEKDGMLQGASIELYKKILAENKNISLIASGGVSNIGDIEKLYELGCYGAIIGKALYEGKIKLEELKRFL